MIECTAVFAVNLLGPNNLSRQTVLMCIFVITVACLDIFDTDPKELKILPLIVQVLLKALQKWRQKAFRQSFDHIVSLDDKDGPRPLAQIADSFLFVSLLHLFVSLLSLLDNDFVLHVLE